MPAMPRRMHRKPAHGSWCLPFLLPLAVACPRLRLLVPGAPQGCAWQLNVTSALGKGAQAHVVDINLVQVGQEAAECTARHG